MYAQKEKLKENKNRSVGNSVAQKKSNIKQGLGFVDNRTDAITQRKLKASVFIRTAEKAIVQSTIQRVTDLQVQQGPSCWLFVLEAVAKSKGLSTNYISMAMHSYASTPEADERKEKEANKGREISKRAAALLVTADKLNEMVEKLKEYKVTVGDKYQGGLIDRKVLSRFANEKIGNSKSVNYIQFNENEKADIEGVIDSYAEAKRRAKELAEIVIHEEDDVGSLLNTGISEITKDQNIQDVHLTLANQDLPAYMATWKIYKPSQEDLRGAVNNEVDFTNKKVGALVETAHAILLVDYNAAQKIVTYKDPNYGNLKFKIKIGQLRAMANHRVVLRPFLKEGMNKSRLAGLKD